MLLMMLIGQAATVDAARIVAEAREMTRAGVDCRTERKGDDILVCARRDADKWRVPFIAMDAGDRRIEDVPGERARLVARPNACAEMQLMAYGCGMVGVSVTSGGRGTRIERPRPPAP